MRTIRTNRIGCLVMLRSVFLCCLFASSAVAQVEITLKNAFVQKFQDRATITATYTVDKAHAHPNPGAKDGDIHVAGRAPEIGLATVAEVMNAKDQQSAMDTIH